MPILEVQGVDFSYGPIRVLHEVSLRVEAGEIVTVLGPNGAGKSTLLNLIAGMHRPRTGRVFVNGEDVTRAGPSALVRRGVVLVPEGRQVFAELNVEENLLLGGWVRRSSAKLAVDVTEVFDLFPRLGERRAQTAGTLSGGEQQMLAIGRGLMARPKLLILDEPSLGLAPRLVHQIMGTVAELRARGTTVLLVEQNARAALRAADRGYLLETGRIRFEGTAAELRSDPRVMAVYLGSGGTEQTERTSDETSGS